MSSNAFPFISTLPTTPMNTNHLVDIRDANLPHDKDISAYEGVEIPKEFRQHVLFMELDLCFTDSLSC
jgi:hypothetical protein